MIKDFTIEHTGRSLTVSVSKFGLSKKIATHLFLLMTATVIIFSFEYESVVEVNQFLVAIYLLPLFMIPGVFKASKALFFGKRYHFDKQIGELTYNGMRKANLSEIEAVEINYQMHSDADLIFLELKLSNSGNICILDNGSKKSLIHGGLAIAKFLKIECRDNYPHGKETLWGMADINPQEVDHLNEHLKNDST